MINKSKFWWKSMLILILIVSIIGQVTDLINTSFYLYNLKPQNQRVEGIVIEVIQMGKISAKFKIQFQEKNSGKTFIIKNKKAQTQRIEPLIVGQKIDVLYNEDEPEKGTPSIFYERYVDYIDIIISFIGIPFMVFLFLKADKLFFRSAEKEDKPS